MNIQEILKQHKLWLENKGGSRANLRRANLRRANLSGANLPPPHQILSADWGWVEPRTCLWLMRLDAENHPLPKAFDDWAKGGECPYSKVKFQRAAHFGESRLLWKPGRAPRAMTILAQLFKEKGIKWTP